MLQPEWRKHRGVQICWPRQERWPVGQSPWSNNSWGSGPNKASILGKGLRGEAPGVNKIRKVYSLEYTNIPKVFFTPHHVCRWCTYVIRRHCCVLGHSCIVIPSHLRNSVFQQRTFLQLLINNAPTMGYPVPLLRNNDHGHAGCLPHRQKATDRQTNRHGRAHKLFFAQVWSWRTPNNSISSSVFPVTALLHKHMSTYFTLKYTFPNLLLPLLPVNIPSTVTKQRGQKEVPTGLHVFRPPRIFLVWTSQRYICVSTHSGLSSLHQHPTSCGLLNNTMDITIHCWRMRFFTQTAHVMVWPHQTNDRATGPTPDTCRWVMARPH
jgi:hypothetical protein